MGFDIGHIGLHVFIQCAQCLFKRIKAPVLQALLLVLQLGRLLKQTADFSIIGDFAVPAAGKLLPDATLMQPAWEKPALPGLLPLLLQRI